MRKRFTSELNESLNQYGLSKNAMDRLATGMNRKYKNILGNQQLQIEAERVWAGMEKVLLGNWTDIHYKKAHGTEYYDRSAYGSTDICHIQTSAFPI